MTTQAETVSGKLAAHMVTTRQAADLSVEVVHAFKRVFIDALSCGFSGAAMPVTQAVISYLCEIDGKPQATVIGMPYRLAAPNAAFANGASMHGLDYDDGLTRASAHPAAAIIPVVLALAEARNATPQQMIMATVLGYDVMLRLACAIHPGSAQRGWHNTAICGVFGATAAACTLLELDQAKTQDALGLATSFSGGIREYLADGAEVKRLHPGKAARDGIVCAELASRGVTGPTAAFDGEDGFFRVFVDSRTDHERLFEGLGTRFEISDAYFKPFPCCRHFHAALDGLLNLRSEHGFTHSDVEHAQIGLYAVGAHGHDHKRADNILEAQMSAPVTAALALVYGEVTPDLFAPEKLKARDVMAVLPRIDAGVDEECERIYPGRRSGYVHIALKDGRGFETRVLDPRGEGVNQLSDDDLTEKFISCCTPIKGSGAARALAQLVWKFEQVKNAAPVFETLSTAK